MTAAWAAAACSSDDAVSMDGGIEFDAAPREDAGSRQPVPPTGPEPIRAMPEPPVMPVLTPCPAGWREVDASGLRACEPWPETGRGDCPPGQAHFLGGSGCTVIGAACPADGWPSGLPATGVLYVRAGAPAPGSGTRADPFATIADALAVASPGDVVALAVGTYEESVVLEGDVTLRGACASGTVLRPASAGGAAIGVSGPAVVLRDLRVEGPSSGIWLESATAAMEIHGVEVRGVSTVGIYVGLGAAVIEDVLVRDTAASPTSGENGRGLHVYGGARVQVRRAVIEGSHEIGVFLGGGTLGLEDVVVAGTLPQVSDGARGTGLHVQGGTAQLVRVSIEDNHRLGLSAGNRGTRILLEDVLMRGTRAGRGLDIEHGAHVEGRRLRIEEEQELGAAIIDATVELTDVLIRGITGLDDGEGGGGINMVDADGSIRRAWIAETRESAVHVSRLGSDVTLEDLTTRESRVQLITGGGGRGLNVQGGARVTVRRMLAEASDGAGVLCAQPDTAVVVEDLRVRGTGSSAPESLEGGGRGIVVSAGASLRVARASIEAVGNVGVAVPGAGATLIAEDVLVRDGTGDGSPGWSGAGIAVEAGGILELRRAHIAAVQQAGVLCAGEGASCLLEDLRVSGVAADGEGRFGRGLIAQEGAEMEVRRAFVERATEVGVFAVSPGTRLRVADLEVRETRSGFEDHFGRGLCAQAGAYLELSRGIVRDNTELSVCAFGAGTEVRLSDVVVAGTRPRPCGETTCPGLTAGIGAGAYVGGRLSLERFTVQGNALAGLQVARDGELDASRGVVRDNPLGANVQVTGYDLSRLSREVVYVDNGRNLDASELAVPSSTL